MRDDAPEIYWRVTTDGEAPMISPGEQQSGRVVDPLPMHFEWPFLTRGLNGDRRLRQVSDGWLVGFDEGEFGGSLWWWSRSGQQHECLLRNSNVRAFVDTPMGLLILTGLSHLGFKDGAIYRLDGKGHQVRKLARLGQPPIAAAANAGAVVVATRRGILKANGKGGTTTLLWPKSYEPLWPHSVAVTAGGTIYIGFNWYVMQLVPMDGRYEKAWLAPTQ